MKRDPAAERVKQLIPLLERHVPNAHCALNFSSPFQLLIATILSAQCTDERVNMVTEVLFAHYPDAESLVKVPISKLERLVHPTGFYRNKAKNIHACCRILMEQYQGQVPKTLDELVALPGVGRKTANVVLGNAYGIASGVVVDTHVGRLSRRLGLVKGEDPVKIEQKLQQIVPQEHWVMFSHWLIHHGRRTCRARKPNCTQCFLASLCPKRI